ncbi:MAG: hypothetical protein WD052_08025 [Bacteroidales bacterium]
MKTMISRKNRVRIFTSLIILASVAGKGYSQGKMADGAWKFLQIFKTDRTQSYSPFMDVAYSFYPAKSNPTGDVVPTVLKSISVENIILIVEENMETEPWMTEKFSAHMETPLEVESWMTIPLDETVEEEIIMESWMKAPIYNTLEPELEVEPWMTNLLFR